MINLKFFFLFLMQICFSQTNEVNQLLLNGEKAFLENNFSLAKEIYTKAVDVDQKNKDFWFNLGTTELKLGENDNACEYFYQAYLLNDGEALKLIKENCPNFRNGSIMSINDVEEKPKFIYGKKEYPLVIGNSLNPKYGSILMSRLKFSSIMSKYKGQVFVQFQINNSNGLDVQIVRVSGSQKEAERIKKEILSIFKNLVTYVSAKNKGVNVDLWERWSQTFNFLMLPYN
ncbi:tetratricopeptide repeat protein [Flavobacterium sp. FlaQc-47]|uniref:tetratricopeptide repeat protein n=1 Tax=Flavobacterium sp. FlaQc-47 TaxID=3374180 RepID=UPI0037576C92